MASCVVSAELHWVVAHWAVVAFYAANEIRVRFFGDNLSLEELYNCTLLLLEPCLPFFALLIAHAEPPPASFPIVAADCPLSTLTQLLECHIRYLYVLIFS